MRKILLTGGGTAGHISPIIAIVDILKRNARVEYLYVGLRSGPEKQIAQKFGINFYGIVTGKRRDYLSFANFVDLFKIFFGLIQAYFLLINFKPDVIFAKGGFVTFPILFWAKRKRIPVIVHESDVIMGRANFWASSFARKICLGFPLQYYKENLPQEKIVYTGTPIRREFLKKFEESTNTRQTILVTGGSQGSVKINQIVSEISSELVKNYEVYHLCGQRDYENLKNNNLDHYHLIDFSNEMPQLMHKADLIISRSGANTLAEISATAKPSILIPLPSAHLDHQTANAKIYAEKNAAVVISEKNLTSGSLLSIINRLMEDKEFRQLLGHHARELFNENATSIIIDILFEVTNE